MAEPFILRGHGTGVEASPEAAWWSALQEHLPGARRRHDDLPVFHRAVRRAAVLALVREARPVAPATLAADLGASLPDVVAALEELERRLFFLVRDASGAVSWAFPVTADATPHHLSFSTGERLYGA